MAATSIVVLRYLRPLVGLPLSLARRATTMRAFHFGSVRPVERGTVGEYALHVQCAWRIEGANGIVTGSADLWRPLSPETDREAWNYEDGNLQDALLQEWLGEYDEQTHSCFNPDGKLVVEAIGTDDCGGANFTLSGGFRLVLFPEGSDGEDWRLFQPRTDAAHLVVEGGRITEE